MVIIAFDLWNAFNAVPRHILLKFINEEFQEFLPYFTMLYGKDYEVDFGGKKIKSEMGVGQGSPSSALLFDAFIGHRLKDLMSKCLKEVDGAEFFLCHDGIFAITRLSNAKDLQVNVSNALPKEMRFNDEKNEVFIMRRCLEGNEMQYEKREGLSLDHVKNWKIHYDGLIVGGIPVGNREFRQDIMDATTSNIVNCANDVAEVIIESHNPTILFPILTSCIMPKIQYIAAAVPVCHWSEKARRMTDEICNGIANRIEKAVFPVNGYGMSKDEIVNMKLAMVCNLRLWSPGIQGVASFVASTANILKDIRKESKVMQNKNANLGDCDTYDAFTKLRNYIMDRAMTDNSSILMKEGSLMAKDSWDGWLSKGPPDKLQAFITRGLVDITRKGLKYGAYSNLLTESKNKTAPNVEALADQKGKVSNVSEIDKDTMKTFIDTGKAVFNNSTSDANLFKHEAISKSMRLQVQNRENRLFGLACKLGYNFGYCNEICPKCNQVIGSIFSHAEACMQNRHFTSRHMLVQEAILKCADLQWQTTFEVNENATKISLHCDPKADLVPKELEKAKSERSDFVIFHRHIKLALYDVTVAGITCKSSAGSAKIGGVAVQQGEKKKDEKHARFHDPYGYLKSLSFDSCGNPTPRTRKDLKEIFKIQQVATDRLDTNEYDDQFHHLRVRQVICSMLLYDQAQRLLDFRNICKNERFRIQRPGRDMVSFLENEERRVFALSMLGPSMNILKNVNEHLDLVESRTPLPYISQSPIYDYTDDTVTDSQEQIPMGLEESLSSRLDPVENEAISDLLNRKDDENIEVCKTAGISLSFKAIRSLKHDQWLSSDIMDAHMGLLQKANPNNLYLNSTFSQSLFGSGSGSGVDPAIIGYDIERVKKQLSNISNVMRILDRDAIFILINVKGAHWAYFRIIPNKKFPEVHWMDSTNNGVNGQAFEMHIMNLMQFISKMEEHNDDDLFISANKWMFKWTQDRKQQSDGSNCGVFALMNMRFQSQVQGPPTEYLNSVNIIPYRRKLIKEIIMDSLMVIKSDVFLPKLVIVNREISDAAIVPVISVVNNSSIECWSGNQSMSNNNSTSSSVQPFDTPTQESFQSADKHMKCSDKRRNRTKSVSSNRRSPDQKFNEARCAIGNMLHMNEVEYRAYAEKALKGCDKVQYYVPLMMMWRKAKSGAASNSSTEGDDHEISHSHDRDNTQEHQSPTNSVNSIIVNLSRGVIDVQAKPIDSSQDKGSLLQEYDSDASNSDASDSDKSVVVRIAKAKNKSQANNANNVFRFKGKVNSTYEGSDNGQRGSVDRSSLGSDEVVGSKST